jgi:hypothetical protein
LEKQGIPTVTITTTAFEELVKSALKDQGASELALVVVPHPIAGHSEKELEDMAGKALPDILKAATKWQPEKK